jgi:hypothetical protein
VDATSDPAAMRDAAVRIMSRGRVSAKRVKGRNSRRETRGESQRCHVSGFLRSGLQYSRRAQP